MTGRICEKINEYNSYKFSKHYNLVYIKTPMNFKFIKPEEHNRKANLTKLVKTSYEGKKTIKTAKGKKTPHVTYREIKKRMRTYLLSKKLQG